MNGTNRTIVGIVFWIALLYATLSLICTVMAMIEGDAWPALFFPHGDGLGVPLADVPVLGDALAGRINDFTELFGDAGTVGVAVQVVGFLLAVIGMFTPWVTDVKGKDNPAQYLWTKRPGATARGILAPWGMIPSAWMKHKALVIVPIVLLPLYWSWALLITIALIIPILVAKAVVAGKVRKAAKLEPRKTDAAFAICPKCKRRFDEPKVKCLCGLILDYPRPNEYGYKVHVCNNGHEMPCVHGTRADLRTVCPFCGSDIDTREALPVTIAMVGAVGAGKTTLMLASVEAIMQVARGVDVAVDATTPGVSKQAVAAKAFVAKTASGELDSECLFLRSRDLSDREIVFNDISGAEFEPKDNKVLFEEYYTYASGIVFAFDPIMLAKGGRGSTPMDVFESFHSMFTQINGYGPGTVSDIPFAVVATKSDIMPQGLSNNDVRKYLQENGQQGFVRVVESLFSEVRYFSATSVGNDCRSAAAPIWWIVGRTDKELASKVPVQSV